MLDVLGSPARLMLAACSPGRASTEAAFGRMRAPLDALLYEEIAAPPRAPDLREREDILSHAARVAPTWTTARCATSC